MKVRITPEGREFEMSATNVKELIGQLDLNEEEVIIIDLDKQSLLTPDVRLHPDQKIEIRRIISGG